MEKTVARMYRLERVQKIGRPLDEVFEFFSNAANLQALTPKFLNFSIETPLPIVMRAGAKISYRLGLFGIPMQWLTLITAWDPPAVDRMSGRRVARFVDQQVSGPYAVWNHLHEFEEVDGHTIMRDVVDYAVPFGPLGEVAHWAFVRRTLDRIFAYRFAATEHIFGTGPAAVSASVAQVGLEMTFEIVVDLTRGMTRFGKAAISELSSVNATAPVVSASVDPTAGYDVEVYFDGDCPLCLAEIRLLKWLDNDKRIRFTDIASPAFDPATTGLSMFELMDRVHGRMPDGTRIDGVEVFRQLYGAVGFRRAVAVSRWPGIAHALHLGYVLFAKNRLRITGRCIDDVCDIPTATRPMNDRRAGVGHPGENALPTPISKQPGGVALGRTTHQLGGDIAGVGAV
jgi:ligand-binding SRPBCC domain-containing protein/predicted DCC family thiol-disulfide oxidoreductase YuxK